MISRVKTVDSVSSPSKTAPRPRQGSGPETDNSAELDFKHFCETTGRELMPFEERTYDVFLLTIKKPI